MVWDIWSGTFGQGNLVWDIWSGTFGLGHSGRDIRAGTFGQGLAGGAGQGLFERDLGRDFGKGSVMCCALTLSFYLFYSSPCTFVDWGELVE